MKHLPLDPADSYAISESITGDEEQAMSAVHRRLANGNTASNNPAYDSVAARAEMALGAGRAGPPCFAPPINRSSMVPHPWMPLSPIERWKHSMMRRRRDWVVRNQNCRQGAAWPSNAPDVAEKTHEDNNALPQENWQPLGNLRRITLLLLMLGQTAVGTYFMSKVLPYQGAAQLEMVILVLFAILFCWVSAGFWTAIAGFLVIARGTDRFLISRRADTDIPISPHARTAIVMPICNEDVGRVMAGLRATYESLGRTEYLERFDFYILSDSSTSDICTAEISAWAELCRTVNGFGRIFYRRRHRRVKRKSGNIDDFCRRWGKNYRYMVVLDADSVMSGKCLVKLVQMMEATPKAGIIQSAPIAAGRDTLYARIQQFSTRVYGPLFTAGLHYWQLGESHYWGHNAIIRMAPFIRHCALAPLPGDGSLSGEILSHDFVEAALMRRAGWGVWIAYDLDGSYEEMPPNLLDELKRDRRWCHGNLMNFRLITARGMHPVHRAVFVTGVMAYLSAPLWFLFLALSTVLLATHTLMDPEYFQAPRQLFPTWPQWHPDKALALFSATATLLFLPKILSVAVLSGRKAASYGGHLRLWGSMVLEILFSMFMAPVRMLFHSRFVLAALLGWGVHWKSPPRADSETGWREALRMHGPQMMLGVAWTAGVFWLNPSFLPWLLPIAGGLILSAPLSVWSSRISLGRSLREAGWFLIPEECHPPQELRATADYVGLNTCSTDFVDAVVNPLANALICSASRPHARLPISALQSRDELTRAALKSGPSRMDNAQRNLFLRDPLALAKLHLAVWSCDNVHPDWMARIRKTQETSSDGKRSEE